MPGRPTLPFRLILSPLASVAGVQPPGPLGRGLCSGSPCPPSASDIVGTWPFGGDPRLRAEAAGGKARWSALAALPDFSCRVLSDSAARRVRRRRATVARRPSLGARERLDAAQ